MTKKHTPSYTHIKPTSAHLLTSSRPAPSNSEPQSVTERINQLRREAAPRSTPEQRNEYTASVSTRTVPPALRRILDIPEVNAPKPKSGTSTAIQRRERGAPRRPPGPAAPQSWLTKSKYAPAHTRRRRAGQGLADGGRFGLLARVTDGEFRRLPPPRSLAHCGLRTFALHWEELSEYEQHYIPALPVAYKEALLSYLSIYGESRSLRFKAFKILFGRDEVGGMNDWGDVRHLDLSGLLSENFTLSHLGKCLELPKPTAIAADLSNLDLNKRQTSKAKDSLVADSWEEEADSPPRIPSPSPSTALSTPHFPNLMRLSLANPGSHASWPLLLHIAPTLSKLTHLSLAYWPRPSMTPNSIATDMISKHTRVSLGGSQFYSDLDDDWHEAANILRRFAACTYSLEWLDLEGCAWTRALTWSLPGTIRRAHAEAEAALAGPAAQLDLHLPVSDGDEPWTRSSSLPCPGPDFTTSWRRITYLHFFQGWIPSDAQSLQNMPAGMVPVQLMRWLREVKSWDQGIAEDESSAPELEDVQWKLNGGITGHAVAEWVAREKVNRSVGMDVQNMRKGSGREWCRIDYGWGD